MSWLTNAVTGSTLAINLLSIDQTVRSIKAASRASIKVTKKVTKKLKGAQRP